MSAPTRASLILGYHEVAPMQEGMRRSLVVTPTTFARHLRYLRMTGRQGVTIEDIGRALTGSTVLPRRPVAITFDDGYIGVLRHAAPLLQTYGYPATVFVPSRLVGEKNTGAQVPPVDKMNVAELREWLSMGFAVGSHTRTHVNLAGLSSRDLESEVCGSRHDLEDLLGCAVTTFSFPFGSYDDASVAAVAAAGYEVACTTRFGQVGANVQRHLLPRVLIGDDLSLATFARRLFRSKRTSH